MNKIEGGIKNPKPTKQHNRNGKCGQNITSIKSAMPR